jgi:hypothetical protein
VWFVFHYVPMLVFVSNVLRYLNDTEIREKYREIYMFWEDRWSWIGCVKDWGHKRECTWKTCAILKTIQPNTEFKSQTPSPDPKFKSIKQWEFVNKCMFSFLFYAINFWLLEETFFTFKAVVPKLGGMNWSGACKNYGNAPKLNYHWWNCPYTYLP